MMRRFCLLGGFLLWLAVISAGFHALRAYEATPGVPAQAPKHYPPTALLTPLRGHSLLIMLPTPAAPVPAPASTNWPG